MSKWAREWGKTICVGGACDGLFAVSNASRVALPAGALT